LLLFGTLSSLTRVERTILSLMFDHRHNSSYISLERD
jgi:hypothetical protein